MVCPSCGRDNLPGSDFCEDCGAQLTSANQAGRVAVAVRELPLREGHVLAGRYTIRRLLAEGRYNLYLAADNQNQDAAMSLLEDVGPRASGESALLKVADLLKAVKHRNLWEIKGTLEENSRSYLVGAALPERTLRDLAGSKPGTLSEKSIQSIAVQILSALEVLHGNGLLHRMVFPDHVRMSADGDVVLAGVERICPLSQPPEDFEVEQGFSPPEAYGINEGRVDARSDIYSTGASMYFALTGTVPSLEKREAFFTFPQFSTLGLDVDPLLEEIIQKAVSKDPRLRFPTASVMRQMFESLSVTDQPVREKAGSQAVQAQAAAAAVAPVESAAPAPKVSEDGPLPQDLPPIRLEVGRGTNVGRVREINQDSFLVMQWSVEERSVPIRGALLIVADGMGGEAEGDKASSLAVRSLAQYVLKETLPINIGNDTMRLQSPNPTDRLGDTLVDGLREANRTVNAYAAKDTTRRGMGSTVTAVIIEGNVMVVGHAGDTRAYLIRNKTVEQITEDHSLVGKLVKMGQMTRDEALHSPQRSLIYRAVGTQEAIDIDVYSRLLRPGDYVLICCDGVWEYFTDAELGQIFSDAPASQEACDELIRRCLDRGADDNATAIVVSVVEALEGKGGPDGRRDPA
ncbi:MAG: protein kinase domain-containing protein [Candidatus Xenobia bacterium]